MSGACPVDSSGLKFLEDTRAFVRLVLEEPIACSRCDCYS